MSKGLQDYQVLYKQCMFLPLGKLIAALKLVNKNLVKDNLHLERNITIAIRSIKTLHQENTELEKSGGFFFVF